MEAAGTLHFTLKKKTISSGENINDERHHFEGSEHGKPLLRNPGTPTADVFFLTFQGK